MKKSGKYLLVGATTKSSLTGLTIAFDLLVQGFIDRGIPHRVVDIDTWGAPKNYGKLGIYRVLTTLGVLLSYYWKSIGTNTVYLLMATSLFGFLRNMLMIWPSHLLGHRIILHLHGAGFENFYGKQSGWLQKFIISTFSKAETIIVLSEGIGKQFNLIKDKGTVIKVVYNSVPYEPNISDINQKTITKNGQFRLLFLSNLIKSKGYLELLEACKILYHDYKIPIECDFCGKFIHTILTEDEVRHPEEQFLQLISDWKLDEVVRYRGIVSGKEKITLLNQAHLFLLPTVYPWEGQPISILEALSFGVPVISTNYRSIPDQVVHGQHGILLNGNNPLDIANAVQQIWQNPNKYKHWSLQARQHFIANFTQEKHLNTIIPIICGKNDWVKNDANSKPLKKDIAIQ
ncbi:MAG: glycosyltransferase family 4 protein [Saprospiraceae bacterium]